MASQCTKATPSLLQAPWHSFVLPARGQGYEFPSVDDEPSKAGIMGGVGSCGWLTTKHGHCGSHDTPSGLHTARISLPTHGHQDSEEAVLFLRAMCS